MGPFPVLIVLMFVLVFLIGIVQTVVKFSATREMAMKKGASSTEATAVALSGDLGTSAAFMKADSSHTPSAPAAGRSSADRIRDVRSLEQQGLITHEQAEARVAEILREI